MISRSASRTRWMMFCLAAWAAMRPNFSGGSLARSSSPTSASGSIFARALERHLVLRVLDVLDHRLDLEQLDLAQLGVELGLDVLLVAEGLLGRRQHRFLERLHDDAAVDALLLAHLLDDAVQVRLHGASLTLCACGGPAGRLKSWSTWAFSIAPSAMATRPASGSWSVISSAVAASSVPRNRRRPPIGARVCTQTRSPSARWKCAARRSGRLMPGDEHSSW